MSSRIKKREEEKLKEKEHKQKIRDEKKTERKLNKMGKTTKQRSKEMDKYRTVEKRLTLAIIIVSLLLLIVLSYVFFI